MEILLSSPSHILYTFKYLNLFQKYRLVYIFEYDKILISPIQFMKNFCLLLLLSLFPFSSKPQIYTPDWVSLDKRPSPAWFKDAKFGIFIHWGLYSVPSWSPKGTYEEWYKYWLDNKKLFGNGDFKGTEVYDYHSKTYGKDFEYANFAQMFKAQDYDPEAWAKLFLEAGAKYVVLTTKHHEGFALWPSKEASLAYGRPWNCMETGAQRDLVGEYANALRQANLKVGYYFSLREWGNPLYQPETMALFVEKHFFPQFKDLVNNYKPDLIWVDGPDQYTDKQWRTPEILAWLYNESPVKDSVVVNDRWAQNTGQRHGDYYTCEYSKNNSTFNKPWEECRGIGFSFGLNQNEDIEDYTQPQALILTLVNIVSQGGNFLLGIGPNANGKIPPIMQERLLQIGQWLKVNGEAIYGSHPWKQSIQWSKGDQNWQTEGKLYVSGNEILKQTVDPEPGYAVKEVFFTAQDNSCIYAILPHFPQGKLILKNVYSTPKTKVSLLGLKKKIKWKQKGDNLIINMPLISYDEVPCNYAWTLKLENVI